MFSILHIFTPPDSLVICSDFSVMLSIISLDNAHFKNIYLNFNFNGPVSKITFAVQLLFIYVLLFSSLYIFSLSIIQNKGWIVLLPVSEGRGPSQYSSLGRDLYCTSLFLHQHLNSYHQFLWSDSLTDITKYLNPSSRTLSLSLITPKALFFCSCWW